MKDKVIVITGASAGIGAALATLLIQQGAKVAAVIAALIERPKADVYTRPGAQLVASYYAAEDMGLAERMPPFVTPRR